jgi:hypothetical protein
VETATGTGDEGSKQNDRGMQEATPAPQSALLPFHECFSIEVYVRRIEVLRILFKRTLTWARTSAAAALAGLAPGPRRTRVWSIASWRSLPIVRTASGIANG